MLYDVRQRTWATDLLKAVGLDAAVLPPLCDAGSAAGTVHDRAAAATGIPAGTPVLVGGPDTELALLGSGVCAEGDVGVVLGTTSPVQQLISEPLLDPAATLWTSAHVVPGQWVLESNAGDTGGAYRWLLQLFFGATDDAAHRAADEAMASEPAGPQPIVCHLGPGVFNLSGINPFHPAAILFRFPMLPFDRPGRGAVLRAFVDSIAFAIRGNVEQIEAVRGGPVGRIRLSGGLSRVAALPRIMATALGRSIEIADVPESASVGCAVLGSVAAGLSPSIGEAVRVMTSHRTVDPDAAQVTAYAEHYAVWRAQVAMLQGVNL
jgi:autoinducer 2 (AI-2) kinase